MSGDVEEVGCQGIDESWYLSVLPNILTRCRGWSHRVVLSVCFRECRVSVLRVDSYLTF